MKVFSVLMVIIFCLTTNIFSQGEGWISHIITTDALDAHSVFAIDLDGDGDNDVLSASRGDDKIAWYENDGNAMANFTPHIITDSADGATSVYAIDIDKDGDIDVLSSSYIDEIIACYVNDGNQNFTRRIISDQFPNLEASSVYAKDVDGDGDIDVLSAGHRKIYWFENDGDYEDWIRWEILFNGSTARSVYAFDMDNDGDIDVFSAYQTTDRINRHMNDGNENFTTSNIPGLADFSTSVYAEDVDGDGDMDVLSASSMDDKIAWKENDGNGNFTHHSITTDADFAQSVYAVDINGDTFVDVLSASSNDDKIAWYENDGSENFKTHIITTDADGAYSVYAADIDGDGKMDVLSASRFDNKIVWYENVISGVNDDNTLSVPVQFQLYNNYPNPFNPGTNIQYTVGSRQFVSLKVYDVLGNEIATLVNQEKPAGEYEVEFNSHSSSVRNLPSGLYFYQLRSVPSTGSGQGFVETKKMILLK